jgi:hypothetical protein
VNGLSLNRFNVLWPTYPVSDDWLLLKSPLFAWQPYFKPELLPQFRAGALAPKFEKTWFKDVQLLD